MQNRKSVHKYNILFNSSLMDKKGTCPICKKKLVEHSELQDKICKMITIKQFANNSPGFDVQYRPFFEQIYKERKSND